jgi:hypothetical protein
VSFVNFVDNGGVMSANPSVTAAPQDKKSKPSFFSGAGCWGSLVVISLSLFLFLLACATPAMVFDQETWLGVQVLAFGWEGIFIGQFAWYANLFWLLSLLLAFFRRWILTLAATLLAILIALDTLSFFGTKVPLDEGFVNMMIFQSYHVGYYLWMASIVVVGIGAMVMWIITRRLTR